MRASISVTGFVVISASLCLCSASTMMTFPEKKPRLPAGPILSPVVHAVVLEAPAKSAGRNDTENSGLFGKVKHQFQSWFNHTYSQNTTSSDKKASARNGTKIGPRETHNDTVSVEDVISPHGSNDTAMRKRRGASHREGVNPLKTSSTDAVTPSMRVTSFLESISASLENMRFSLLRILWAKKKPSYEIRSRNETMMVAHVAGKRFFSGEGAHVVKPVRTVYHSQKLTVEVEEAIFEEIRDKKNKLSEQTGGIGTEHLFVIKGAHPVVEDIYLRATNGETPGYDIIIPLRPSEPGESDEPITAISRTLARAVSPESDIKKGHWGTHREEDAYEFLQTQLSCQRAHGASGIKRMICTCEKVHTKSETRRLLCASRIADKVVRIAKDNGEGKIASGVYRGSLRCRNSRLGISGSYACLTKMLESHAGAGAKLHQKFGRSILSSESSKSNQKVDEALAEEKMDEKDFVDISEDDDEFLEERSSMMQMLMFMVYVLGFIFLLVCFLDVSRQYRRHSDGIRSSRHLSRLPEHAQGLYARLGMRSE